MEAAGDTLAWRAHPARERAAAAAATGLLIAILTQVVWIAAGPWLALVAVALLTASLRRFFFPSWYRIDDQGISARCVLPLPTRRELALSSERLLWADLRRFVADRNGGFLSTRRRPSRLDAYSGMHILFGDRRQDVSERIESELRRRSE